MDLNNMTAKELLALVAQAAEAQTVAPVAPAAPSSTDNSVNEELEALKAENARMKAITSFGITEEMYTEQSAFINFEAITPEQYNAMFGQAQPSETEPQVDPVSKYATNQKPVPAINNNEAIDIAIAEALGYTK